MGSISPSDFLVNRGRTCWSIQLQQHTAIIIESVRRQRHHGSSTRHGGEDLTAANHRRLARTGRDTARQRRLEGEGAEREGEHSKWEMIASWIISVAEGFPPIAEIKASVGPRIAAGAALAKSKPEFGNSLPRSPFITDFTRVRPRHTCVSSLATTTALRLFCAADQALHIASACSPVCVCVYLCIPPTLLCGGAGQARNACVCAPCPAPVTPPPSLRHSFLGVCV